MITKKKLIIYFLYAFACISLQSCLYQEDNYFDDSSANRATADVKRCDELLKSAPNGWKLEYYSGSDYSMGGIALLCKFDGENVSIMSEVGSVNIEPGVEVTSLYEVVSEQSTLLTFNSFNELIHCFSEPILKQNTNLKGDYEFAIMKASENEIVLQGKKYHNMMTMTPIPADVDWPTYINSLHQIADEAFLNDYVLIAGGEKVGEAERYSRIFSISIKGETLEAPFVYTPEGFRFREPIVIGGKALQNFKWNKARMMFTCTDTGAEHVSLEGVYPEGYKKYEEYPGFYFFYYKTLQRNAEGSYEFVDAMPFIVQLKQKVNQESYVMMGADLDVDLIVNYEKSIGKIVIKPQRTADPSGGGTYYGSLILGNSNTNWLPAYMGTDFGYITSYTGFESGLVAEESPESDVLSFVEYGSLFSSLVGKPATSLVMTVYDSNKFSGSSFLGYWNWMDSISLMPYRN